MLPPHVATGSLLTFMRKGVLSIWATRACEGGFRAYGLVEETRESALKGSAVGV